MNTVQKIKKRLVGKHLYYYRKQDGQTVGIGEYIGQVIDITSGFSVLVKNAYSTEPSALPITKLNKQHRNGEVAILQKAI